MTAPPLKRTVLNCRNKRRYSDEFTARAGVQSFLQYEANENDRAWIYRCTECGGWHMTSKSNGRKWMVTRSLLFCAMEISQ